jgi:DNA-binding Xre family transcriptional regulator
MRKGQPVQSSLPSILKSLKRAYAESGLGFGELATTAGLCPSTVERLLTGETRWPRFATVEKVCFALSFLVVLDKVRKRMTGKRKAS